MIGAWRGAARVQVSQLQMPHARMLLLSRLGAGLVSEVCRGHERHTGWLKQNASSQFCRRGGERRVWGGPRDLWTLPGGVHDSPAAGASATSLHVITWPPSPSLLVMPPVTGFRAQPHSVPPYFRLITSGKRVSTRGHLPGRRGLGLQLLFPGDAVQPTAQHVQ